MLKVVKPTALYFTTNASYSFVQTVIWNNAILTKK